MSWALRKRAMVVAILGIIALLVFGIPVYLNTQKPATCTDGEQNGSETGVDCGGECTRMCLADIKDIRTTFVRAVQQKSGKGDVIAFLENPNTSAGFDIPFELTVYDADNAQLAVIRDTIDLLPGRNVYYKSRVFDADVRAARAFISFDVVRASWSTRYARAPKIVAGEAVIEGLENAPRVRAQVQNVGEERVDNQRVVAILYDKEDNAHAATQTILSSILPDSHSEAIFTWNEPFTFEPTRIEIVPVFEP